MPKSDYIHPLMDLGFTELEAEVYSALLQESPATGYRVAQITGRLPGNVYKALESLQSKGAIIIDEGASRMCRAVPPSELLSMLRRRYLEAEGRAAQALEGLHEVSEDNRVYQIRSYDQVMERARQMLTDATATVAADLFPDPMRELAGDLQRAAARGLVVAAKTYERGFELPGVVLSYSMAGEGMVERANRDWIVLMTDGMELLIAAVERRQNRIVQAFWTRSATLAYLYHCATVAELSFCKLIDLLQSEEFTADQAKATARLFTRGNGVDASAGGPLADAMAPFLSMYGKGVPGQLVMESGVSRQDAIRAAAEARVGGPSELRSVLQRPTSPK